MAMTAEAIVFAINSAIRLGRNAQRAYAKSLTSKSIVLPLPKFSGTPNAFTAQNFFDNDDEVTGGATYLKKMERLADIHDRFKNGVGDAVPTNQELDMYVAAYAQLGTLVAQEASSTFQDGLDDDRINADELVALLSIRQYTHDSAKHTNPLQMVAGTLVEIGIDYFNRIPGALNEQSATGRTLKHFLKAFDELKLSDNVALHRQSRKIVPQLFIAAAESISDLGQDATNDPKVQGFIKVAGKGIAEDLFRRLEHISDSDNQEEAVNWGRFLLRSTVSNAGSYVFASPREFFDTNSGASELIKATSTVLLDAILQDPDKINIKDGLNAHTLDRLLKSSFGVLAEHPQLIHHKNGFQEIVSGVSSALKDYDYRRPDLFPELVRLVLEQTGQNLRLFRQPHDDHGPGAGNGHDLLISAVQLILAELSRPVSDGQWRPRLSKSQLLFITEQLLDKVVRNPNWMIHQADGKPLLAAVIRATMDGLARIPATERLSAATFEWLLQRNLRVVAANELVLQKIKWSNDGEEEAVLQQALNLVFAFVFEREHTTSGDRNVLLFELLDYIFDVIISRHPDKRGLLLTDLILFSQPSVNYQGGFNRKLANQLVDAALATLAAHPELISRQAALGEIVAGIAGALDASSFKQEDILLELVRLSLENTALNAHLIVNAESDEPEYLLVVFIRELLLALSTKEAGEEVWQPQLTPTEAMMIVDNLVNELILHPEWVVRGPDGQVIFRDVLQAVLAALHNMPPGVKLSPEQLEYLIALALTAAVTSEAVMDKIPWGTDTEKRSVLERALSLISTFIFHEMKVSGGERTARFAELVEYVLDVILAYHPDRRGLLLVQLILFSEDDIDYSRGFDEDLLTDLIESALRVMEQQPELVSSEMALQAIVRDLAKDLDAGDFRQKGILPELLRMSLEASALNAHLIVDADADEPRFLIVIALREFLGRLASTGTDGKWRPQLTGDDMLSLAEELLDAIVDNPAWVVPVGKTKPSIWQEVLQAIMDALALLPADARLSPTVLENLILLSMHTAATSPQVLQKLKWGSDEQEKAILERALQMLVNYVYPPDSTADSERLERFLELLDFVLETIISQHPNKRSLILLDLLLFESEVDLTQGFQPDLAEELVQAGLAIMDAHPELIAKEAVFQKILSDTAGALRASKTDIKHLLPEFIRLILLYSSGHLERLMRISPNSPRILVAVALEQVLRVVTQPPSRGSWSPKLTDQQLLEIIELVLERVIERPEWVGSDRLIQLTLEAIYTAVGELKRDQHLPFETISFLVGAALDAVGQRRQLVLEVVKPDGGKEQMVLQYALGEIFIELYDEQTGTSASWTLTEAETLQTILESCLVVLAPGPADQETVDELLAEIRKAAEDINNNLTFALEDLTEGLENV